MEGTVPVAIEDGCSDGRVVMRVLDGVIVAVADGRGACGRAVLEVPLKEDSPGIVRVVVAVNSSTGTFRDGIPPSAVEHSEGMRTPTADNNEAGIETPFCP